MFESEPETCETLTALTATWLGPVTLLANWEFRATVEPVNAALSRIYYEARVNGTYDAELVTVGMWLGADGDLFDFVWESRRNGVWATKTLTNSGSVTFFTPEYELRVVNLNNTMTVYIDGAQISTGLAVDVPAGSGRRLSIGCVSPPDLPEAGINFYDVVISKPS
ncbi:MAG: hypothetical protein FJ029_00395 [Actinobacteria bacterium]|nr:hypothetical protein [Actinomycetota bacterium]